MAGLWGNPDSYTDAGSADGCTHATWATAVAGVVFWDPACHAPSPPAQKRAPRADVEECARAVCDSQRLEVIHISVSSGMEEQAIHEGICMKGHCDAADMKKPQQWSAAVSSIDGSSKATWMKEGRRRRQTTVHMQSAEHRERQRRGCTCSRMAKQRRKQCYCKICAAGTLRRWDGRGVWGPSYRRY